MHALRFFLPLLFLSSFVSAETVRWPEALRQHDSWYATPEARAMAESVLLYQTSSGGWPKNTDMTNPPTVDFNAEGKAREHSATIDNNATTPQLRFFARFVTATGDAKFRASFERGFDYLIAAQYENGGWPQFYPLRKGYYTHITYNDNAMINVLVFLRDAATHQTPFAFLDDARRERAATAVTKGITCILRTQVRQDGKLTAWCAQHDESTLAPAWARNFEPPSLSGGESVGIVKFLMAIDAPSPEIIAAVEGAAAWFEKVKITGLRYESFTDADGKKDRRVVPDPAAPPLWARFYELGTDRPLFTGRDKAIHYSLAEIERERRAGYSYYVTSPASMLTTDYPRWKKRTSATTAVAPSRIAKP